MSQNKAKTLANRFQADKHEVALLRREGLKWHQVFPLAIRQTLFPSVFKGERED